MPPIPEVRARISQEFFGFLDEYRPGLHNEVRRRVSASYITTLAEMPPNAWIPFELSCEGVEAAVDVLGPALGPDLWRKVMARRFIKTPIIGGLIEALVRLFGMSPGTLVKAMPRGFEGSYRHVADVRIGELDANSATVWLERVTPLLFSHEKYLVAWQGTFEGFFELTNVDGTLTIDLDPAAAKLRLAFRW